MAGGCRSDIKETARRRYSEGHGHNDDAIGPRAHGARPGRPDLAQGALPARGRLPRTVMASVQRVIMSTALPSRPGAPRRGALASFDSDTGGQPSRRRRAVLLSIAVLPLPIAAQPPSLALASRSGGVLLIRHAQTDAGIGDPPGFRLEQCSTQRNLSEAGRIQARAIGQWARRNGLRPTAVLSSQWCRCQDTARLAFEQVEVWPALNSTFAGQGNAEAQVRALRERMQALAPGALEIWVTHQVIMTALSGAYPDLGEGFLLDARGQLLARGMMQGQGESR